MEEVEEVTKKGACGLIPQTNAAILLQITFIILIIIIVSILMIMAIMVMTMMMMIILERQSPLDSGWSTQWSSHDRWTSTVRLVMVMMMVEIMNLTLSSSL